MTNEERYKTTDDRVYAFRKYCRDKGTCHDCALNETGVSRTICVDRCILNWLALEAEEEKPLNCPFCGGEAESKFTRPLIDGYYYVHCKNCHSSTRGYRTKDDAIDAWNRRVK